MENKTTIGISMLIILGVITGNYIMSSEDMYFCEDRPSLGLYHCDNLSKYYGLNNGKCWNEAEGNKLCRSGWLHVEDDTVINEEDIPIVESENNVRKIICDQTGCVNYVR